MNGMNGMNVTVVDISTSAMLVDLSIKAWSGIKTDGIASKKVASENGATGDAGRYHKHLLAGASELRDISKFDSGVRAWSIGATLPWSDKGPRLLPSSAFFEYKSRLSELESQRNALVDRFLAQYVSLIAQAESSLGGLFKIADYPSHAEVSDMFEFKYSFLPVPSVGDFRVDIGKQGGEELARQFEVSVAERVTSAMNETRERLRSTLVHMSDRLDEDVDGCKIFRDSLITNAREVVEAVKHLNLVGDVEIEKVRASLAGAISNIEAQDLRDYADTRRAVKREIDAILHGMGV